MVDYAATLLARGGDYPYGKAPPRKTIEPIKEDLLAYFRRNYIVPSNIYDSNGLELLYYTLNQCICLLDESSVPERSPLRRKLSEATLDNLIGIDGFANLISRSVNGTQEKIMYYCRNGEK